MSLIHDAIRQLESGPTTADRGPGRHARPSTSALSRPGPILGGMFLVFALGAGVWWFSLPTAPKTLAVSLQLAAPPVALSPTSPLPAPQALQRVVALEGSLDQRDSVKPVSLPPKTAGPTVAFYEPRQILSVMKPPRPNNQIKEPPQNKISQAAESEVSLDSQLAMFLQAMKADDLVTAGEQLAGLQKKLPPGTLTRLRAEAWYSLRSGKGSAAKQTYRAILERIPGDEEASLNLAFMEVQANRRELALQVLTDGLRGNPDSEPIRDALARFKSPVGN